MCVCVCVRTQGWGGVYEILLKDSWDAEVQGFDPTTLSPIHTYTSITACNSEMKAAILGAEPHSYVGCHVVSEGFLLVIVS